MATDDELMSRIAKGEQMAFATLFDRHSPHLLGYANKLLQDHYRAEDLVQDLWIKIVRLAPSYQGKGHFVAWAYTLLRNQCFSELKKSQKMDYTDDETKLVAEEEQDFEKAFEERKEFESIIAKIDQLPANQRLAILMWAVEGLSYDDIATELNTSVSSVKSLLFRARKELKGAS